MIPYVVYDLDLSQAYRHQNCDVISGTPTVTAGSFANIVLYTDAASGFPLTCPITLPAVTAGCTYSYTNYYVDQTTLPVAIVTLDHTNGNLIFDSPAAIAIGDYSVVVKAFLPSATAYEVSQVTFTIQVRQALTVIAQTCDAVDLTPVPVTQAVVACAETLDTTTFYVK